MSRSDGEVVTSQADMANVFAEFYEESHADSALDESWTCCDVSSADIQTFSLFSATELSNQVRKTANCKAVDKCDLSAELRWNLPATARSLLN